MYITCGSVCIIFHWWRCCVYYVCMWFSPFLCNFVCVHAYTVSWSQSIIIFTLQRYNNKNAVPVSLNPLNSWKGVLYSVDLIWNSLWRLSFDTRSTFPLNTACGCALTAHWAIKPLRFSRIQKQIKSSRCTAIV